MTEDEAKTKACCGPQVIAMTIALTSPAMVAELIENPGRCIASACMAWRIQDRTSAADTQNILQRICEHRELYGSDLLAAKQAVEADMRAVLGGYCGLAGALPS